MAGWDLMVTFEREGFHRWPEAPREVDYLRETHRHIFKCRLTLLGLEGDRQEEFHLTKRWAESVFSLVLDKRQSCERMAMDMAHRAHARFNLPVEVEIWEDGECGSRVRLHV